MVTPSNIYSDIGDFAAGENGWWFGKTGDHAGLKAKLEELGVDVIHRDTSTNRSNYTPESGAAFYAEDEEELYLGDGNGWVAQDTWGRSPKLDQLSAMEWNVVDVAVEGYPGDRTGGDLVDLFAQYPDSLFVLHPGKEYEMSTWAPSSYDSFGLVCPTPGNPPSVYAADPCRDSTGAALQVEFFDLGGHASGPIGPTLIKNITFRNTPTKTSTYGWRYDHGLFKAVFDDVALIQNVEFPDARHKIEDNGDGTQTEHGSRYQNRIEGGGDDAAIVLDQFRMTGGGTEEAVNGSATGHAIGMAIEEHYGHLTITRSVMDSYVDNGWYTTFTTGDGSVTMIDCEARNCSNSNFRPGPNHTLLNCRIRLIDTGLNEYVGVGLHPQDVGPTTVLGFHIEADNHPNDLVRVNSKMEHCTLRDVTINNQNASNRVAEIAAANSPNGTVILDGWQVDDAGGTGSHDAAIFNFRDGTVIRDSRIHTSTRTAVRIREGLTLRNCNLQADTVTPYHALRIWDSCGTVRMLGCTVSNDTTTIQQESGARVEHLQVEGNDFTASTWDPMAELYGDIGTLVWHSNRGYEYPDTSTTGGAIDDVISDREFEMYDGNFPTNPYIGMVVYRKDSGAPSGAGHYKWDGTSWSLSGI